MIHCWFVSRFEASEDIKVVDCPNYTLASHELTVTGVIASIGEYEEREIYPICHSTDVEIHEKSIKCVKCKSRTISSMKTTDQSKIKLNIMGIAQNTFELVIDKVKIGVLLQECNHQELSTSDLIEEENVLVVLSSLRACAKYNPKSKHVIDITLNKVANEVNNLR